MWESGNRTRKVSWERSSEWKGAKIAKLVHSPCPVSFFPVGIQKGDRVAIYMPMILELVVAMLACARLGALHSIVVGAGAGDRNQG